MREFDTLLPIFAKHSIDLLTVHARTVAQMYRLPVHYELIRQARRRLWRARSSPMATSIPPAKRRNFCSRPMPAA